MRYLKVTNAEECHHGFQYHDGFNKDIIPFEPKGSCVPGGLYFTDHRNIHRYYIYGVWVREVELPTTHPEFQMVEDPRGGKWRASCIGLGKKVSLLDPAACLSFGVPAMSMDCASWCGHVEVLEWWKNSDSRTYSSDAIDWASQRGRVDVLQWWLESGLILKYTVCAIQSAILDGNVAVLDWWKTSGLTPKLSMYLFRCVVESGHITMIKWCISLGLDPLSCYQMELKKVLSQRS